MTRSEHGGGTIRTVLNRSTGEVLGYRALLPREHSAAQPGTTNPTRYQQPIGPLCATAQEARTLLNAALVELTEKHSLRHGLPVSHYVQASIKARLQDARRDYCNEARAQRGTSTWRSVNKCWLPKAAWYGVPPSSVPVADLQEFFNWLRDEAETQAGEPLSGHYIRIVAAVVRSAFDRAGIKPNPADSIVLPKKGAPRIAYLELAAQRRFFASPAVELADRVLTGCGMGAGLRVGELLAIESSDVRLDDHDPHLLVRFGGAHRAPTKGRRVRRVELFEPGLGFWRLWMQEFRARRGELVFGGPRGGYRKSWPECFPGWAPAAEVPRMTSHIMRHSYAVSVLSGTWGYEPRSLEFVSQQLGHRDITTTQRYYGAFEQGVWQREVQRMTGRVTVLRVPITAESLLGADAQNDARTPFFPRNMADLVNSRQSPKDHDSQEETGAFDASAHQALVALAAPAREALERLEQGDPVAVAMAVAVLRRLLLAQPLAPALQTKDEEARGA